MSVSRVVGVVTLCLPLATVSAGCGDGAQPVKTPASAVPPAASTGSASGPTPTAPTFRLPTDAHPDRYDLEMWLDPESIDFHGRIGVDLTVTKATSVVWLNGTGLAVDSATFRRDGTESAARVARGGDDFLGFETSMPLAPGHVRLTLAFHGQVDRERSRGIYGVKEQTGESYLYTFFEETDSRRAFPSFDEPGYKVPWKLTLHVPHGDMAAANSPQVSNNDENDGTDTVAFAESKPLPSYLVAFVAGPFDAVDAGVAGREQTRLRFLVPQGHQANLLYAREVTPRIVGLLESYFGMPYPFEKLDVAVVPRYWGTMEHPGLLAMGQPLALLPPGERDLKRKQSYANIAIHELGHYWFGDYVTAAWWDDIWLNEGLTTWVDAKITNLLEPSWRYDLERVTRAGDPMLADALADAKPVRRAVRSPGDIQDSLDNDSAYFKGQSVFTMFEAWLGPERTQKIVQKYLAAHAWKTATSEDLYAAFEEAEPGAGQALRSFVEQPGMPLVTAQVSCEGKNGAATLTLEQRRFHEAATQLPEETWQIPVCVRYGGAGAHDEGTRQCTLLANARATVPLTSCPAWLEPNAEGLGYYHSVYAPAALAAAYAHASDGERIALFRDATALVGSGDARLGDVLARVPASATSPVSQVVRGGLASVTLAREMASAAEDTRLAHFLGTVYAPLARKLGLRERQGDDPSTLAIRVTAILEGAVEGDDPALRATAHAASLAWLEDEKKVDPRAKTAILCAGARSNDAKLFDGLLDKARKETDKRRQVELIDALGSFTSPELVARAQSLVTDGSFDLREGIFLLSTQLGSHETRGAAWTFLQASFEKLAPRMRSDEVNNYLLREIDFCDVDHLRELEAFAPRVASIDGASKALGRVIDRVRTCSATADLQRKSLAEFLARY
jgi:aminopeptidase N